MTRKRNRPLYLDAWEMWRGPNLNSLKQQVDRDTEEALSMLDRAGLFSTVERYKLSAARREGTE